MVISTVYKSVYFECFTYYYNCYFGGGEEVGALVRFVSVESCVETNKHFEFMLIIYIHTRFHITISNGNYCCQNYILVTSFLRVADLCLIIYKISFK
jgi:hypothetical protein